MGNQKHPVEGLVGGTNLGVGWDRTAREKEGIQLSVEIDNDTVLTGASSYDARRSGKAGMEFHRQTGTHKRIDHSGKARNIVGTKNNHNGCRTVIGRPQSRIRVIRVLKQGTGFANALSSR